MAISCQILIITQKLFNTMLNYTNIIEKAIRKMKPLILEQIKPRNSVAKDLRTPKYRMRVANSKKLYNRNLEKKQAYENQFC
jgi:hypothetical protein